MLSRLDLVLLVHQRLVADDQVLEILTTSTYHATTTTTRPPNVPGPRDSEESSTWPAVLVAPRPSGVKHRNESSEKEVSGKKMDVPQYRFRLIDAAYIIGSIITFLADQTTGKLSLIWMLWNN